MTNAPRLETRDLLLMQALLAHGGVTKAARALSLSQSAVSHHLSRLEQRLEVPLTIAEGRGLALTAAGRRLARQGGPVLDALVALEHSLAPQSPRTLSVSTQCHTAYDWLAPTLARLEREHPGTLVRVRVDCTRGPFAALRQRKVDVAVCHGPAPADLHEHPLGEDPFVVVLSPTHPAAAHSRVKPRQLRDDVLLVHEMDTAEMRKLGARLFGDKPPRRTMRLPVTEAIVGLVAAGYGSAIMPRWASRQAQRRDDVVVRPLQKRGASRVWRAVCRSGDESRADVQALTDELVRWFDTR